MTEEKRTIDPAVAELLFTCDEGEIGTAFSRAENMKPCPIGRESACCKNCFMGPCRLTGKDKEEKTGVCGASMGVIAARNLLRAIAAGAASHSDHGRDMAFTLLAVANGEAPSYQITDVKKLHAVAGYMGIPTQGRSKEDIARDVATQALRDFGQQGHTEVSYVSRATPKRQKIWRDLDIVPRAVDREIVEALGRTHIGDDQQVQSLLTHAMRCALGDGWAGSMLSTDISDILFGTPNPGTTRINLGVLADDEVNIIVHGHEPTLSMMIVAAAQDPEMIEYARSKGAKGINLSGICCTANEILMRQGVSSAGNFLSQELAIITGAVEAMVVDIQCIFQALVPLAESYHTEIITTSPKVHIEGATHIEFDEHRAMDIAKEIVKRAIDNYPNRGETRIPEIREGMVAGFSHEYIRYMLGGTYRASFRPLNDAIISGRIRGAVGIVGCNNPRTCHDLSHAYLVKKFIENDVLVVMTGCGALCAGKYGMLTPEALAAAGHGLREVCETVGMPPVLHLGSCVDNTRILTILTEVATEGGLGEDIDDLPAVGLAPEWMSEKALSIATYFVASGAYVIMGVGNPVEASSEVNRFITDEWEKMVGGRLEFVEDPDEMLRRSLAHIDKKREALKLVPWDPDRFKKDTVTWDEALGFGTSVSMPAAMEVV
ncbi:MAG: anaerobic carbon-monoxide dehydrogenase catalytic subunit [Chloroflexi bacterium]|nr:anaerobic carbon-monoxide dehydrogenase catalytic subunit [Chloroflexota bacterium]MBU1749808.1 anaerobic carbon-monoxide dehydrogenase catalytic subunit [Chloroflexota bacterium]